MKGSAKSNAVRSGLVVIGSLAFGYLTLQIGFKPFLQNAQQSEAIQQQQQPQEQEPSNQQHS